MTLLAVPNLSEGRDARVISTLGRAVTETGAILLDSHSDAVHNRTVLTVTGDRETLIRGMVSLATTARDLISLEDHEGVHPRIGALDVCPFVPFRDSLEEAVATARAAGQAMGEAGIPVFLYGIGSAPTLPELRREGLEGVVQRIESGRVPDFGPHRIDPRTGVVCVGARGPLIAFNVNLADATEVAKRIADAVRSSRGGPRGLRALGLPMQMGSQVSMNITQPEHSSIESVFAVVAELAERMGAEIVSTELVGLVEERFLPHPDAQAARLLIEPGRSVESALRASASS